MVPKLSWSISLPDNGSIDPGWTLDRCPDYWIRLSAQRSVAEGLIWWKKMEINSCHTLERELMMLNFTPCFICMSFFFSWSARGSFHRQKLFRGVKIDFFTPYGDGDFGRVEDERIAPKTPKSEVTHEDEASGRQKCFAGWLLWLKIQDQPDYHATRIVQQNDSSSAVMLPKKENWINGWLDNKEIIVK